MVVLGCSGDVLKDHYLSGVGRVVWQRAGRDGNGVEHTRKFVKFT